MAGMLRGEGGYSGFASTTRGEGGWSGLTRKVVELSQAFLCHGPATK